MKVFRDFLFGLIVFIVIMLCEFTVTLPFGDPWELSPKNYSQFINKEFLCTALPAGIVTFLFAALLKTKSKAEALKRSGLWTAMIGFLYLIIGIGNDNYRVLFGNAGMYILLACAFAGPNLYAKIKHLK